MILGLGCDIVQISRFAKDEGFLFRFIKKICTLNEIKEIEQKKQNEQLDKLESTVATRFAAKEAVAKALGSGFQNGITLKDIEITHDSLGCPTVTLYNKALSRAYEVAHNQNFKLHITLSNEQEYANAVAVLES